MKKLKRLNLPDAEILNDSQMKMVVGGYESGGECYVTCKNGEKRSAKNCEKSTADTACGGTGYAEQCGGKLSVCG